MLPISAKIKAPELADTQIRLMKGLITRGYRIVSNAADGAAVERDCQRRLAAAGSTVNFTIKSPGLGLSDFAVSLCDIDGNIFVNAQDSKHALKTFRNNIFTGACVITLGNFVATYQQVHNLAQTPGTPLYNRDVVKYDKQDDNAASRLFSADMLDSATKDPEEHLGLVVYLFVFGEFVDAFQSRTMDHKDRVRIVLRTRLFLDTWKIFLKKQGYTEAQHFISREAYNICCTLTNSLLGFVVIYRDHIPQPIPLIPWKLQSEGDEHVFSDMRKLVPDFSVQHAILSVPKLHVMALSSSCARFKKANYKATANGYQHTYLDDTGVDYEQLMMFPSDADFVEAYQLAAEENDTLWTLLGIHPDAIKAAPMPAPVSLKVDESEGLPFDDSIEDDANEQEMSTREELQAAIDSIEKTYNLTCEEDEELDACTHAAIALSLQELASMYVPIYLEYTLLILVSFSDALPDKDEERTKELRDEVNRMFSLRPGAVMSVIKKMATDADANEEPAGVDSGSLFDVTSADFEPLSSIYRKHQTEQARKGIRTYKPSTSMKPSKNRKDQEAGPREVTDRERLMHKISSIKVRASERGSSTGLNRTVRWKEQSDTPANGNSANAVLAAKGRASDMSYILSFYSTSEISDIIQVMKRRRTAFKDLKCSSCAPEASITKAKPIENGTYGVVVDGEDLYLGKGKFTSSNQN